MAIPPTHVKERLSMAYVQAIVAAAGAHYSPEEQPEYGLDCTIKNVVVLPDGNYNFSGFPLHCQVKSTTDWIERPNSILYDMKVDAYNKLVSRDAIYAILILFRLPKIQSDWVNCCEDFLQLKNCCYWTILTGPTVSNASSKRIEIPRSQLFTPQAVVDLLDRLRRNRGCLI